MALDPHSVGDAEPATLALDVFFLAKVAAVAVSGIWFWWAHWEGVKFLSGDGKPSRERVLSIPRQSMLGIDSAKACNRPVDDAGDRPRPTAMKGQVK